MRSHPFIIALLALGAPPALAQPCLGLRVVGNKLVVSPSSAVSRGQPAVAYSATSDLYVIVWREVNGMTGNDVWWRSLGADGTPGAAPETVVVRPESQAQPAIAWNSTDNQFLIIWESQELGQRCWGRTLTPPATLGASDFEILTGTNEVRVAHGVTGNRYLVTARSGGCDGQRVNPNSTLEGGKIDISTAGAVAPNGDLVYDTINNRFFAIWRDQGDMARNVQGRIMNPDASFLNAQFVIMDVFPNNMSVAFNPNAQEFLVVCDRLSADGLRARRVSATGVPVGDVINITDEAANNPAVAYHPGKGAYVVAAQRGREIVAYVVEASGAMARDKVVISNAGDDAPAITYNPDTMECLVVWTDRPGGGNSPSIITARRLDFGGGANACSLCGIGLCGFGIFPLMPVMLLGWASMKRWYPRPR